MYTKSELMDMLAVAESVTATARIAMPEDVVPLLAKYRNLETEGFFVVCLDGAQNVIETVQVSQGLLNKTIVHPREVYRLAIKLNCASIIVAHNHPSGNLAPSKEDREITGRLKQAGDVVGVQLLDHVIISSNGFYSFLSEGCL